MTVATPPAEPRPVRIPCPPPRGPRLEEAELLVGVVDDLGGVAFRLAVVLPVEPKIETLFLKTGKTQVSGLVDN